MKYVPSKATLLSISTEVDTARTKFPGQDINTLMIALTEEVGELAKEVLDKDRSKQILEAVQVAAMAIRIIEGC